MRVVVFVPLSSSMLRRQYSLLFGSFLFATYFVLFVRFTYVLSLPLASVRLRRRPLRPLLLRPLLRPLRFFFFVFFALWLRHRGLFSVFLLLPCPLSPLLPLLPLLRPRPRPRSRFSSSSAVFCSILAPKHVIAAANEAAQHGGSSPEREDAGRRCEAADKEDARGQRRDQPSAEDP